MGFKYPKSHFLILLYFVAVFAFLFVSCDPDNPISVEVPISGGGGTDTIPVPIVKPYFTPVLMPEGGPKDSMLVLQFSLRDSGTVKRAIGAQQVDISLNPAGSGTFSDDTASDITSIITGTDGLASIKLLPIELGVVQVNVTALNITTTYSIDITAEAVVVTKTKLISLEVLSPIINADGNSESELKVTVKDKDNHPVTGEAVEFLATGGLISARATTDDKGTAMGWIRSERKNKTVQITAKIQIGNEEVSDRQSIVFTGVQLSLYPAFPVIKINEADTINLELKDAGGKIISNDSILLTASSGFTYKDTDKDTVIGVTNAFGQYTTWIKSASAGDAVIEAHALGATAQTQVKFTLNSLTMTSNKASIPGDGASTATITAHLRDDSDNGITGAELKWSVSYGSLDSNKITGTDGSGKSSITLTSPTGAGGAVVSVQAKDSQGRLLGASSIKVVIDALSPRSINLTLTPDNIRVDVGEAVIQAEVRDILGNLMENTLVGFTFVKSTGGGGESFETPMVVSENGLASTIIKAGKFISAYQGVQITALVLDIRNGDTTQFFSNDTVSLTISGPPAHIALGYNLKEGKDNKDGTYELPIGAIVTDINGNLVADGTKVNFSLVPVAYHPYLSDAQGWSGPTARIEALNQSVSVRKEVVPINEHPYYSIKEVPYRLSFVWGDLNNNFLLDPGESGSGGLPYRGEDINGDGIINTPPDYLAEDINGDGLWQGDSFGCDSNYTTCKDVNIFCNYPEPCIRKDTLGQFIFADLNGNFTWDTAEVCVDMNGNGQNDCMKSFQGPYEYNYQGGRTEGEPPLPYGHGGGVKPVVETGGGKSVQAILYPQSDAWRISVRVTAEANGIKDEMSLNLPVIEE